MLAGPVFTREAVTAPRRPRLYVLRAAYVAALLVLMCTAWLLLTGTQVVRNVGDLARFGGALFGMLAPLQLALVFFFSALLAAGAVAQEKDRRTLVLLLLTNLKNSELVLGKLLAALVSVLVLVAASLPLFMLATLFGGIGVDQIARSFAVTVATALAAGSIGSTIGFWREKTFQTLALTVLVLVSWLAVGELVAQGALGDTIFGVPAATLATWISPWRAIQTAVRPVIGAGHLPLLGRGVGGFMCFAAAVAILLNALSIACVRIWNPSREARPSRSESAEQESIWGAEHDARALPAQAGAPSHAGASAAPAARPNVHAAPGRLRPMWDNPILWREVRTWAYGRRVLAIRLAYLALFAVSATALHSLTLAPRGPTLVPAALALVPFLLLSLALINAQAVTSLTSERDVGALDLLLVTDLTAKEFVFGKIGGVLYNTKEMILLPAALCIYLAVVGAISVENTAYLVGGLVVLCAFAAMLGIHAGMVYANSRSAIAVSLGTLFFLFVGVAVCMRMMIAFSGSFQGQLQPFLAFMLGGGIGLYTALGVRNASTAIGWASFLLPIATFYAITSFWLGNTLAVFLVVAATYGFTTASMLMPAIFEFDVATGRTTIADE